MNESPIPHRDVTAATACKDYGGIDEQYSFYDTHTTEAESDLAGLVPRIAALLERRLAAGEGSFRILDFGCGPGTFTRRILEQVACPPQRLALTLVDPVADYRKRAAGELSGFTRQPIVAREAFAASDGPFDLVLANHVLYYVADLEELLPEIHASLAAGGQFLAAVAGEANTLNQFWERCFALLGMTVPYHTAETIDAMLERHGIPVARHEVDYRLAFDDTPQNRAAILRFLMAERYPLLPEAEVLALFDPHAREGRVEMDLVHDHFVIDAAG